MDFSNRNVQPQAAAPGAQTNAAGNSGHKKSKDNGTTSRVVKVVLGAIVILLVAAVLVAALTGKNKPESKYVDSSKLQAVFLNTGQVYFGSIKSLNNRYFVLSNIYYLQTANGGGTTGNANNASSSVTLVKLGCELHEPFDQMLINRDQVTFWENLQDNGQVAKAVSTFQKQNPNGQKCADQSASSSSTTNSTQPANNGSTGTTPATKP